MRRIRRRSTSAPTARDPYPCPVTVLLFILGVLVLAVGLALSIALHELGHLVPAKLFGVKVNQYMIGFGPTLFSRTRGETEYGVKAIPFGGYVSMIGMYPPAASVGASEVANPGMFRSLMQDAREQSADQIGEGDDPRTFYRLPVAKRLVIMFGGTVVNLVIGVILVGIVLVGIGVPGIVNRVTAVSPCLTATATTTCPADAPPSPASTAGFRAGDAIVSIDGTRTPTWTDASDIFQKSAGDRLSVVVRNDGANRTLSVTPVATRVPVTQADGSTRTQTVGRIGIAAATALQPQPITSVLPATGRLLGATFHTVATLPARLADVGTSIVKGTKRPLDSPMSIVGAGRVAGDVASTDQLGFLGKAQYLLQLLASLNIFLFVLNLVPLPPLDGGQVVAALWEGVKRIIARVFHRREPKPTDTAKLIPLTFGVVAVLGALSVFLIVADIVKPINPFG